MEERNLSNFIRNLNSNEKKSFRHYERLSRKIINTTYAIKFNNTCLLSFVNMEELSRPPTFLTRQTSIMCRIERMEGFSEWSARPFKTSVICIFSMWYNEASRADIPVKQFLIKKETERYGQYFS